MFTVYLVDDSPLVIKMLEQTVGWADFNLEIFGTATDPIEAYKEILEKKPHVVFTDIKMPQMNGLELMFMLKEQGIQSEFVALSAFDEFNDVREFFLEGGFDYLTKSLKKEAYDDLLSRLCERLAMRFPNQLLETSSSEFNAILNYMNEDLQKKHTLEKLAKKFNLSVSSICGLFSRHLNTTFSTYLTKKRMDLAASMLRNTDELVKNIAIDAGYDDYFYFCRVFKNHFSKTPTAYRNSVGNKR